MERPALRRGRRYRPGPVFEWEDGQLRAARLCFDVEELEDGRGEPREGVEAITAVLDHPSLRELTVGIQLAGDLEVTMQPVVDIIAARPRPSLRSLSLLARPMEYPFAWDDERYAHLGATWRGERTSTRTNDIR